MAATLEIPGFGGTLLGPGNPGYDDARTLFNAMFDRRPLAVARCSSADDVAAAVKTARERGLDLTVFGGGHGVTGAAVADGALCIDLRGLKGITVDPDAGTARAEAGLVWGEVDAATQDHGLAVTGGRASDTGIGGLALGSGSGWLERKFGFTCDNLLATEVVTADGRQIEASTDENPELFWGLRGGGGNFGIVTAFHFRLHPVGPILLGGMLMFPAAMARDLVAFYADFISDAPDEVLGGLAFICAPPADFVPEPVRGQPVVGVVAAYAGPVEAGEEALRPLREFGPPAIDMIESMPYVAFQQIIDAGNPWGMRNYWSADFLGELPDKAIDTWVAHATNPVSPMSQMLMIPGGGALSRVDDNATAFGNRNAPWNIHLLGMWPDPADDERNIAYVREFGAAMKPWTTGRTYLNYIGDEGAGRVETAFGPEKFARLQKLKDEWDPTNVFHHNQNIPPTVR
ncbi:MAG: FAD-binding oxidoreductase [Acidimicrobiia bacterium]